MDADANVRAVLEVFAAIAPDLPDLHASLHTSPSLG